LIKPQITITKSFMSQKRLKKVVF